MVQWKRELVPCWWGLMLILDHAISACSSQTRALLEVSFACVARRRPSICMHGLFYSISMILIYEIFGNWLK
jgi:hypothetical protein